jgi:protein-L-isoaspartate(D-aspartate) O-methyltransferase
VSLLAGLPLWIQPAAAEEAGDVWLVRRERMVAEQLADPRDGRDPIRNDRVLEAMRVVPRHLFVPPTLWELAYGDHPLPIGHDQTISQPYIVALMSELADIQPGEKVLEIGTGSGYHAAILARLTDRVYTIEILEPLAKEAKQRLHELGLQTVQVRVGDGYLGWPAHAPFDAIIVTAAVTQAPAPLLEQLATNGRLVLPLGPDHTQELSVLTKTSSGIVPEVTIPVRFVPMIGRAREGTGSGSNRPPQ